MATTSYNFTIDDSSPMIKYEPAGAWTDKVANDPNLKNFYESSYHYTTTKGAFAALTFTGTGITVLGSRSLYHGAFELRIDGQRIRGLNSFASAPVYRGYLGSVRGLTFGKHTVQFINRAGGNGFSSLDLDAFIVETTGTGTGSGNTTAVPIVTVDDAVTTNGTSTLTWTDGWAKTSKGSASNTLFLNGTIHESTTKGSSVTLDFVGEGFQLVGATGPNNTEYSVAVDGGRAAVMNARSSKFTPSSTLFYQTNLRPGSHKVVITNTASDGGALTIDSFQVFGNNASVNDANGSNIRIGIIVGAVLGGVLVLLLLLVLALFLWRRKKRQSDASSDRFSMANASYMDRIRNVNFTFPALPGRRKTKSSSNTHNNLTRSSSRGSEDTIVDPESGNAMHTQKKAGGGYGFGLGGGPKKWLDGLKGMVVRNPDPVTPPLPVMRERPVLDIRSGGNGNNTSPGMVTVGLESGVPGPNVEAYDRPHNNNPEAARVWVDGAKRIENGGHFSNLSLDRAWENRDNDSGHYGAYSAHKRNHSTATTAQRPQVPRTGPRESEGAFTISTYQSGQGSPSITEYPETPARPRYEVERIAPVASRYANNARGQRSDFR
ncbi:hypothetical protein M408DRAFT_332448 [Serendipita vermifera MAFF 305830]|uniref:Transmembrane protein n=1 Tax=Serendipita vermifera MAFF 305830 TaxID=933852 RepID=A0A0C2X171_SERVB|nr:hypothetical protein M408DRAFT_332448 [Serendipita vermifera MAFF 305830]